MRNRPTGQFQDRVGEELGSRDSGGERTDPAPPSDELSRSAGRERPRVRDPSLRRVRPWSGHRGCSVARAFQRCRARRSAVRPRCLRLSECTIRKRASRWLPGPRPTLRQVPLARPSRRRSSSTGNSKIQTSRGEGARVSAIRAAPRLINLALPSRFRLETLLRVVHPTYTFRRKISFLLLRLRRH